MLQKRPDPVVRGYELRQQLGEGSYGAVYRAYQPQIGRDVAIKIILPQYANYPDFIRRFEYEAQVIARLEHPYIVPLYDYWRAPDGAYLVMRWLRGGSLHEALLQGPLPGEQFGRMIDQIGGALVTAHRRGVVHRDLKPANILLDEEGNAYLADFGIAKDLGKAFSPYRTDAASVVGSPAYISPEQVKSEPITPQTDIYSLGVMLYEILTGQLPFRAPTPIALMFMHINEQLPPLRERRPDLPAEVDVVIRKATAKNPSERYADVMQLVQDLRRALGGEMAPVAWPQAPGQNGRSTGQAATHGRATGTETTRLTYETGMLYLPELVAAAGPAAQNPYKGLCAFQEADAADFFGREVLTELLLERMRERGEFSRFLAVVGPSGSGKSSVVRAGVVPAIRRGALPGSESWFVVEMFPTAHPVEQLAEALLRIAVDPPNNLVGPLQLDNQGLLRIVDQVVPGGDETEVVLVIDQFEEIFTLVEDEAVRTHFLDSLINAITDPYSRIRVIVTLRADFYDRPLLYPGFSELMRQRTEVVVPLAPEELKEAIVSPAERVGLHVAPELVEAIVADVGEQPGALPLLQYALTEVFERRADRTLTLLPYQASGGVLGALARRAEEIYAGLRPEQQELARQLFLRLVTLGEGVEDTRRRVQRSELVDLTTDRRRLTTDEQAPLPQSSAVGGRSALDEVINLYSQHRLLTLDRDAITRVPTVEVAHEALIRTWGRLREWLDASRDDLRLQRRLATAAAEWAIGGHERSFLASGARLVQFASWAAETHLALNAAERAFLDASLAERDAQRAAEDARKAHEATLERRSRTFLRAFVAVALVAAVLGIGLSVYAFGQRRVALSNEQRAVAGEQQAEQNAREVQSLALSEGAQAAYFQGNIDLARQLALAAAEHPSINALAEQTLANTVYNPGARLILSGHTDVVNSVVYSPDETMALSGGRNDQVAILWDLKSAKIIKRFSGHTGRIRRVAFLPDGKQFLTGAEDGTIRLWDVSCATPSAAECNTSARIFLDHADGEVKAIAVRPNRNEFVSASNDNTLKLWDLGCATPTLAQCATPIRVYPSGNGGHTLEVNDLAFTSDGKRMLSSSEDATLILWDVDTGAPLKTLKHPDGAETRGVAILPGDQQALSTGASPDVIRWDLTTGQVIDRLRGHRGTVYFVSVSADGKRALSSGDDNAVILWDLEKDVPLTTLRGHGGYIRQVVFSKDETHALSASADQTIRLWDLNNGAERLRLNSGEQVNAIDLSVDGRLLATGSDSGAAQIWDLASGKPAMPEFRAHPHDVKALALSPDGKYLVTGGGKRDGTLVLTDLQTGRVVPNHFKFQAFGFNSIAFTPDGKRLVTGQIIPGGDDYTDLPTLSPELKNISLIVWDVVSGEPLYKLSDVMVDKERHDSISRVLVTPDGAQIIGATAAGTQLLIWDLASGAQAKALDLKKDGRANDIALTPDGKLLIAGTSEKRFVVWDLAGGERLFTSEPEAAAVSAVALSSDGRYAATTSDVNVFVWDLQTKQKIRTFTGHRRDMTRLRFTSDGQSLISASRDGTTRAWRVESLPQIIDWAKSNRFFPGLTCEQEKQYGLDEQDCK